MADHGHHAPNERASAHIVATKTYGIIIFWLMVLLIITLGAASQDLGMMNLPIAMVIAVIKVYLVMTYFMHLKFNSKLVRFFALGALAFLMVMFIFTISDYASRHIWMAH
jgi:cytochrome c oxidase subunit 4